jgi:N utilization substance protein A
MQDLVISGAPLSVLMDHGLSEAIAELLVGAGVGTVERLGSMTPEELVAIPGIDEATVGQIQTAVMSFYGQFEQQPDEEAAAVEVEAAQEVEAEAAMVSEGGAAEAVSENGDSSSEEVATGLLEHDMARHEAAVVEDGPAGEVLDLGNVEGLSAAPSTLGHQPGPDEIAEKHESGTMKGAE